MWKIADLKINKALLLAPMEDVTDISYRVICKEMGADIVYTEFVNSDGLIRDCKRAKKKMELLPEERPAGIQIYGHNIDSMVEAAKVAQTFKPEIIDINAGCWVKKVSGRGAGSGLLKDPDHFEKMVRSVVQAVDLPVTVKTRLGWDQDSINILEVAPRIQEAGAVALTLHCRTRSQGHTGEAHWSWIDKVKAVVDFPVAVNGDVMNAEDAKHAFESTSADAVMIARGAIGRPWVFREARELIEHGRIITENNVADKVSVCLRHLSAHIEYKGSRRAIPSFRKYYAGYLKGLYGAARLRSKLVLMNEFTEIEDALKHFASTYQDHIDVDLATAV